MTDTPKRKYPSAVGKSGGTHASAISRALISLGYTKFHQYDRDRGGYYCTNWGTDSKGFTMVKVEFRRPGRGLKGKPSEATIARIRREKLVEITNGLIGMGYQVTWGWDEDGL